MAHARGILNRWRCRRLQAALVDCAEGELDPAAERRVRRHTAACAACASALTALEQMPAMLRELPPPARDEDFWRRQRQSILRRVRPVAAPVRRSLVPRLPWVAALAAAAALFVFVSDRRVPPPAVPQVATVEGLEGEEVAALADLMDAWSGEVIAPPEMAGEILLPAEIPWVDAGQVAEDADIGALDEEELERLEELIG